MTRLLVAAMCLTITAAPAFAQTMDDANQALDEPLSDHSAITVVLPLVRPASPGPEK